VLADGAVVGRIMKAAAAPVGRSWLWTLAHQRPIPRGVPRTVPFSDPNSPEATGGGNIGYNRGLPDGGY
jgi:hypothetical protein